MEATAVSDRQPIDLDGSDAFFQYVKSLRRTASYDPKNVSRDGNANTDFSTMATSSDSDGSTDLNNPEMTRRTMMIAFAAAGATAAGMGTVSADGQLVPNFGSELTPAPWVTAEVEVAEHTPEMSDLGYIDNDGNQVSLADAGGVLAPYDEPDEAQNHVRIRADYIDADILRDFPRDVTRTVDDEEEPVSALDAQEWTSDNTVEDVGDALRVTGLGTATFDNFEIDSGEQRKHLQVVANVNLLEADSTVSVRVIDAAGNSVEATIDPDGDTADEHVIATAQNNGIGYQTQLGEMTGGQDLDTIEEVEIEIAGADAEVVFYGLDLENESKLSFGQRQRIDEDDEVETVTVREPTGWTGIQSTDDLDEDFGDATVENVRYDAEFRAEELPNSDIEVMVEETDRHDRPARYHMVGGFDTPSAFDLSIDLETLYGQVRHSSSRYLTAEIETSLDELPTMADVDDIEWTDRTADFEGGSIDDELELSSTVSSADVIGFHFDLNVEDDVAEEMSMAPGGGGAAFDDNGGLMSTIRGWALAIGTGIVSTLAALRFWGGE